MFLCLHVRLADGRDIGIAYSTMASLGEMATFMPVPGSFTSYGARFVDPSLGFAMGWIYWFSLAMTFALELTAAGLIIQYWKPDFNIGISMAVFWVVFTAANFLPVRRYGELEMWFSSIKLIAIVGFIIFALCVNVGVGTQGYLGFRYWKDPGPFVEHKVGGATGKFVGFWTVLIIASFSYQGVEAVGLGAGEALNPHKTVPVAIRNTFWGVASLFVATLFFIGVDVPSNDKNLMTGGNNASASPLVLTAVRAGIPVVPHVLNAVLLTAVLSVANSTVYAGSRTLVALVNEGSAPSILKRTNKQGTPYFAVAFTSIFGLLGFINLSANGGLVFNWLMDIIAVAGLLIWICIQLCHVRFMTAMQAQGIARSSLPYLAPCQPYLTWFGLFFNTLITITNGFAVFMEWSTSDFMSSYGSLILFGVLFGAHKLICRTKTVQAAQVDLLRGRMREVLMDCSESGRV